MSRLTRAQRDFLELGLLTPERNPWLKVGIRSRGGKLNMAADLKRRGYLDANNRLTDKSLDTLSGGKK